MVESAGPDDAPFLADCWRAMLVELAMAPAGLQPDWRDRLSAFFAAGMRNGSQGWFVLRHPSGKIYASAGALISETSMVHVRPASATIAGVYVSPDRRREGAARALTRACIDWARERGCELVQLRASEPARSLYLSLGFVPGRELILPFD